MTNVNVVDFLTTSAYVLVFAFIWRQLAALLAARGSKLGAAMGAIL